MKGATIEPCAGRGCKMREDCECYRKDATQTFGLMDSDMGWTCEEWRRRDNVVVDREDGEQLEIW